MPQPIASDVGIRCTFDRPPICEPWRIDIEATCTCGSVAAYHGPLPIPQMICRPCGRNVTYQCMIHAEVTLADASRHFAKFDSRN